MIESREAGCSLERRQRLGVWGSREPQKPQKDLTSDSRLTDGYMPLLSQLEPC